MIFHCARITNKYENTVQIQENKIDPVNATKSFRTILDNKKLSEAICIIYQIRSFLNRITLHNLYHTFVFPYLI